MWKRRLFLLIGVMAILTGCTAGSTSVVKQSEVNLRGYQVAEVPDLEGIGPDPEWPAPPIVPRVVRRDLAETLVQELKDSQVFAEVRRETEDSIQSVLLIKGRVVHYSPGSRAERHLGHKVEDRSLFHPVDEEAGEGNIIVNVKFIEKATGKELAEAKFEGVIESGFFGGSMTGIYSEIAQEIVKFLKANS